MEFSDKKQITVAGSQFKLIDEGVGVLSWYATKRHLKLDPTAFPRAPRQSLDTQMKCFEYGLVGMLDAMQFPIELN